MTHALHDVLPNFHRDQIFHDGCPECEERGRNLTVALAHMDMLTFERAWARAADWQRNGCPTLSRAEMPLLEVLWAVQVKLERRGIPLGEPPARLSPVLAALFADPSASPPT